LDIIRKFEPLFGEWHAERRIGVGSFGRVYRIVKHEEATGAEYFSALKYISLPQSEEEIKQLRYDGMDETSISDHYGRVIKDISAEIQLMYKLRGHTNIVAYEDHRILPKPSGVGHDIFIRMELLTSLNEHMLRNSMTDADIIRLGTDLCNALQRCQRQRILHRDIKPDNIFISENGDYKLGDFGIARQWRTDMTRAYRTKIGSPNYMAPEVHNTDQYDARVDIYSLGIVLYRLLNNKRFPFEPQDKMLDSYDREEAFNKRLRGDALPLPCNAHNRLGEIVLKACAFDPEDRYQTPQEMRTELVALADGVAAMKAVPSVVRTAPAEAERAHAEMDDIWGAKNAEEAIPSAAQVSADTTISVFDMKSSPSAQPQSVFAAPAENIPTLPPSIPRKQEATSSAAQGAVDATVSVFDMKSSPSAQPQSVFTAPTENIPTIPPSIPRKPGAHTPAMQSAADATVSVFDVADASCAQRAFASPETTDATGENTVSVFDFPIAQNSTASAYHTSPHSAGGQNATQKPWSNSQPPQNVEPHEPGKKKRGAWIAAAIAAALLVLTITIIAISKNIISFYPVTAFNAHYETDAPGGGAAVPGSNQNTDAPARSTITDVPIAADKYTPKPTPTPTPKSPQKVANPSASLKSGTYYQPAYPNQFELDFYCATSGAIICFTDNGNEPTLESKGANPVTTLGVSFHYDKETIVTIKIKAFKEGMLPSDTVTYTYTLIPTDIWWDDDQTNASDQQVDTSALQAAISDAERFMQSDAFNNMGEVQRDKWQAVVNMAKNCLSDSLHTQAEVDAATVALHLLN